jgi:hypothetical protein
LWCWLAEHQQVGTSRLRYHILISQKAYALTPKSAAKSHFVLFIAHLCFICLAERNAYAHAILKRLSFAQAIFNQILDNKKRAKPEGFALFRGRLTSLSWKWFACTCTCCVARTQQSR